MVMEKEFVPYEIAFELKELGFDEPCIAQWNDSNGFDGFGGNYRNSYFTYPDQVAAPLYQQVFRWFREKYNYHYEIVLNKNRDLPYTYVVDTPKLYLRSPFHKTYEEAQFECLKKLIEIVKNK
jgi:hypothetical protein